MRAALRTSSNRAAVRMLEEIGIPTAVRYAERLGVGSVPSVPSLALGSGEAVYRIATVQGGEQHGTGRATLEGGAEAGTLVVTGTAADGATLEVRVRCERFTALVAEGG